MTCCSTSPAGSARTASRYHPTAYDVLSGSDRPYPATERPGTGCTDHYCDVRYRGTDVGFALLPGWGWRAIWDRNAVVVNNRRYPDHKPDNGRRPDHRPPRPHAGSEMMQPQPYRDPKE
eukprot:2685361-Rhodomonas_salina.7